MPAIISIAATPATEYMAIISGMSLLSSGAGGSITGGAGAGGGGGAGAGGGACCTTTGSGLEGGAGYDDSTSEFVVKL